MRLLIELPLTIALFTLAVKYGWPYTVVFVLGYILAFAIKLPYLSKRVQVSTRFLVFLGVFLAFAMTTSAIIGRFFFSANGHAWIEAGRIRTFLLVTPALKALWAAVLGFGLIAVVAALILLPYGYSVAQNIYSQYEEYKGHEKEAVAAAIGAFLGINRGTWIVSNNQAEVRGDPAGGLARFGGPGVLIVQQGHAVILEISGKISRVVGWGITFLKPFERISMVVPLQSRGEQITIEQIATKDKILIESLDVLVFHRADLGTEDDRGTESDRPQAGLSAYSKNKLIKDIWSPGGGDWRNGVRSVTESAVRDAVGRYDLVELLPMSDKFRQDFREMLKMIVNTTTRNAMGVEVVAIDFGKLKVPDAAQKLLLDKWLTDWSAPIAEKEIEIAIMKGKGEVQATTIREVGQAEAKKEATAIGAEAARIEAEAHQLVTRITAESEAEKAKKDAKVQQEIANVQNDIEAERKKAEVRSKWEIAQLRATAEVDYLAEDDKRRRTATVEDARADAEALIIKGRAQAEANADSFRRVLSVMPDKDRTVLLELIKRLRSEDDIQAMMSRWLGYAGGPQRNTGAPSGMASDGLSVGPAPDRPSTEGNITP
jgi:regulator of protease activity HflC (stomatin/prohibitin superfamily)